MAAEDTYNRGWSTISVSVVCMSKLSECGKHFLDSRRNVRFVPCMMDASLMTVTLISLVTLKSY